MGPVFVGEARRLTLEAFKLEFESQIRGYDVRERSRLSEPRYAELRGMLTGCGSYSESVLAVRRWGFELGTFPTSEEV